MKIMYHESHNTRLEHALVEEKWQHASLIFQIDRDASFQSRTSLALVSDSERMIVRRCIRRYNDSPDTDQFVYAEGEIERPTASTLIAELEQVAICPFAPRALGLDGTTQGVRTPDLELSWWGSEPDSWKPLAAWYDKAWGQLQHALPGEDWYF
ncbi:hypothetical protein [Rubrivivax gelatinosus]|uniref:hypothetical protein n=1 Tax=Rubrivivax gelatinosus TaxID=28068 RepID=UPI0005C1E080|nr:hypothetical protein [Rubrivivax gelatinosus]MBG6082911.1 hypothetical protein [Rubrivivax gelatinosus]